MINFYLLHCNKRKRIKKYFTKSNNLLAFACRLKNVDIILAVNTKILFYLRAREEISSIRNHEQNFTTYTDDVLY